MIHTTRRVIGMILVFLSLSFAASADTAGTIANTEASAKHFLPESQVEPCRCSQATPLSGIGGLIFNCDCGPMKCAVAGPRVSQAVKPDTINIVCR